MRPVSGLVCQSLMVSSYCRPGSAHSHAALAMLAEQLLGVDGLDDLAVEPAEQVERAALLDGPHELVGDPHRVVGVLVLHADDVACRRGPCRSRRRAARGSCLPRAPWCSTNSSMSGWSTSRMTILAARRVAPPDLMVPALASAPRMKLTGPEAVPPEESSSLEERMRDRLTPEPEPPLKISPSSLYQSRIESIESSTDEDEAGADLLRRRGADVEPDRRVEAEHLVQQHPGQLVLEDLGVGRAGEVAVLLAGRAVGLHHPVDELLERPLALRRADRAAEVLGGDDVGRVDAPEVGELHARAARS